MIVFQTNGMQLLSVTAELVHNQKSVWNLSAMLTHNVCHFFDEGRGPAPPGTQIGTYTTARLWSRDSEPLKYVHSIRLDTDKIQTA